MRGGGASSTAIPPGARKLVQNVKELSTGHSDDEIYAMLKECNMDPDESAQRLMNQDTFHEVKRKKDRKKDAFSNTKDAAEGRSRGTGSYRGGRGGGRGVARYVSSETNGRGRGGPQKENGSHAPSLAPPPEIKPPPPAPQFQPVPQSGSSLSAGLPNGSMLYQGGGPPVQVPWSKIAGHATMADMLKSQQAAGSLQKQRPPQAQQQQVPQQQQFPSSGMYSSGDPVHHPFSDPRSSNVIKREIGIVGNQRPFGDRGGIPSPPSQASSSQDELRPLSPPQEAIESQDPASAVGNGRPTPYQPPGSTKQTAGINLEWKPKMSAQEDAIGNESLKFPPSSVMPESEVLSVSSKFQSLSARDEHHQQVIMPNNFQSQGDLGLSFGSFGESFGSSIPSGFNSEEPLEVPGSPEASVPGKSLLSDDASNGASIVVPQDDPVHHQDDMPASKPSSGISSSFTSQADISKLRAQQAQYSYLQPAQSYSSAMGMVSQIPSAQYDSQESHLEDLPTAPAATLKQQHYSDSAVSYYSPAFRPSSDGDARYAQYLATNTGAAKYANGAVVMAGQQHLPSHEVTTSTSSSATTQSANTHSVPAAPQQPVPVHAYPAQPTGVPVGHFGNVFGYHQFPSYTYMHSPYQHSYTANYPQPPVSSYSPTGNYSPASVAAAVKYPVPQYKPGSATANAPISSVTGAYGGYGTGASSMYAGNPSGAGSTTPGYEDPSGTQYKDSNLYMHGPQGERLWQLSSDVAAQASSFYALSGQSQHASYGQQPSSHTHPAMASYTSLYHHPGAAAQQQQQQPGTSGHQMIQQPQTLSGAAGSTQAAAAAAAAYHQQLQRIQQQQQPSWNTY